MSALPWHHRWNILALTLLSQAIVVGIQTFSFAFWVVPWLDEFKAPHGQLMLTITLSVFVIGLLSPMAGAALDRLPVRRLFCCSAVIFALALFLLSLAGSHWMVLALYGVLLPVGTVITGNLGCQTLIARWFQENRGFALGISSLGVSIGAFAIPPVTTALLAAFGWRGAFQVLAAAALVLLVPTYWLVLGRQPEDEAKDHPQATEISRWTTASLLRSRDFRIIAFGFAAILFAYLPMLYSLGALARELGISQQEAALGASLSAVALALGKLAFGRLTDRIDHRFLYQAAMALMSCGLVLIAVAGSFWPLIAGLVAAGFAQGCYLPLMSSMIAARFGTASFGQVAGLVAIFIQIAAVSPFIAGLMRDHGSGYTFVLLIMVTPLLPAMIAMRWLSTKR